MVAAAAAGWVLIDAADQLTQHNWLPELSYPLVIILVIHGVLASAVLSWFHGARGNQRVRALEVAILTVVAASWVAWSVWTALTSR